MTTSILRRLAVAAALGVFATAAFPMEAPEAEQCEVAKRVAIPKVDLPSVARVRELSNCRSEDLYYGITRSADYLAARQCAYLERNHRPIAEQGDFSGNM